MPTTNFPWWTQIEKGQGFFIPALDLDATREAGLRAAVRYKILDGNAKLCIMRGQLGVLFYRPSPARK